MQHYYPNKTPTISELQIFNFDLLYRIYALVILVVVPLQFNRVASATVLGVNKYWPQKDNLQA